MEIAFARGHTVCSDRSAHTTSRPFLPESFHVSVTSRLVHAACFTLLSWSAAAVLAEETARGRITPAPELPASLPWNLATLGAPPAVEWLDDAAPVRSLLYAGELFEGRATRVFAYYATPASVGADRGAAHAAVSASKGPWPGIVLVHGGGGTAFSAWVTLWAKRGYAAIAMDLAGSRPDPEGTRKNAVDRLPDGGPGQDHKDKFDTIATPAFDDDWPYHAVANVIRAHSLLRSLPGVDPDRTAITGISWGGYTTCLVASLDDRFRAAVPVYGCGHLRENSCWLGDFSRIGPEQAARWAQLYDPAGYLPACRVPIFFVNGTNDFAYPLDSFMKSHADVRHAPKNVRIQVNMPHGHEEGWKPPEIAAFIDAAVRGRPALPLVEMPVVDDRGARCRVTAGGPVAHATLVYTAERGPINKLTWQTLPAEVHADGTLAARRPPDDTRVYFFTATTPTGLQVSSPAVISGEERSTP
jgi:dienelactone hydrolase